MRCYILLCLFFLPFTHHSVDAKSLYGDEGIAIYSTTKHGPDGALFLDPYFVPHLMNLEGKVLLDAGCGSGPWAIFAAQQGATVYGIDIQEGMIAKAKQAALEQKIENETRFVVGDVNDLPYPSHFFDRAISINVGCNLTTLETHVRELHRVLKAGGIAIITAPNSFGTTFTNGKRAKKEVVNTIEKLLNQDSMPAAMRGVDEVYRATFSKRGDTWKLVVDEKQLQSGESIWRKIPGMVVPNYYHSEEEYLALLIQEGFEIQQISRLHFANRAQWEQYNRGSPNTLSEDYVTSAPFVVFIAKKLAG